jgi:hypothetical protein
MADFSKRIFPNTLWGKIDHPYIGISRGVEGSWKLIKRKRMSIFSEGIVNFCEKLFHLCP